MMRMLSVVVTLLLALQACSNTDLDVKDRPQIEFKADGVVCENVTLEGIVPIPGAKLNQRIDMEIRNNGKATLTVQKVEMLDANADGTPRNPWVRFDWGTTKPADLPHLPILPNDFSSIIRFAIVYEPESIDTNGVTVKVTSDDPDYPTKTCFFKPPECLPKVHVDPPEYTYINATSAHPETQVFQIQNLGNCVLRVDDIQFAQPESKFTITRTFPNGSEVLPSSDPSYKPLTFTVKYQPEGECGSDAAVAQVFSSDPAQSAFPVSLKTSCEEGTIAVSYQGQDKGCLDFTDVGSGDKTLTVSVCNNGPAIFSTVQKAFSIPEDPDQTHYKYAVELTGNPPKPVDVDAQGLALNEKLCMDVKVTYHGSILGMNATLVVKYKQGAHDKLLEVPMCGGKPKPCIDLGPGDVKQGNNLLQFHGAKDEALKRPFVIYNCGNAELTLKSFVLTDDFYPDQPSKYWTLDDAPAGDVVIAPGGLEVYSVTMKVSDNELKVGGKLDVHYIDPTGAESILAGGVDLAGIIDPAGTAPIADAGKPEDYAGAVAGTAFTLDGSHTQAGSEGIFDKGYQWFLTAKPEGSLLIVNGPAGDPYREVIADKPGPYTFMLQVFGMQGDFLYSDPASVTVDIGAP